MTFTKGDKVEKVDNYSFDGTVISEPCLTSTGKTLYLVEHFTGGWCHVFSEKQIRLRTREAGFPVSNAPDVSGL